MVTFDQDYNPGTVALACAVAFVGAYATVSLLEQFRMASVRRTMFRQILSLIMAAVAFGAVGQWGVFYMVINSCRLKFPDGSLNSWRYDITYTFLSLAVSPFVAALGLWVASTDHCFNKSKKEIMDLFITRTTAAATYSISEIKHMSRYRILFIVCTHAPGRVVLGGIISGGGAALTRYLGLRSLVIPGELHYDQGIVAATVILSIVAMTGGFWVFFRVLSIFSSLDWLRFACAVHGILGLCGIHYLALAGIRFEYDSTVLMDMESSIGPRPFIVSILCATVIYSFTMLVYVLSDLREWLLTTSTQLRQADLALAALMKKSLEAREPHHYNNHYHNHSGSVGSPHSAHSAVTQTHFQAPLEVINYTRKYMYNSDDTTRTSQIGFAGMVLPPPMYNDFNVESDVEMGNLDSLNNSVQQALYAVNTPGHPNNINNYNNNSNNNSINNNTHQNGVLTPNKPSTEDLNLSAQFRGQLSMASKSGSGNSAQLVAQMQLAHLKYKPLASKSGSTNSATVLVGGEACAGSDKNSAAQTESTTVHSQ